MGYQLLFVFNFFMSLNSNFKGKHIMSYLMKDDFSYQRTSQQTLSASEDIRLLSFS